MNSSSDRVWVIERAKALGFDLCGVVRADKFSELALTDEWLARGYAGEMKYLADRRRTDPQTVMPQLCSVIVCALNYNSALPHSTDAYQVSEPSPRGWISRYAWGDDYHEVLQQKLRALAAALSERFPQPFDVRIYSDTGPINERVFAKHAGLGWLGKNTLLLNSKLGSWFFLGTILTTLDLPSTLGPAGSPPPDLCGSCTRCIDACPTDALVEPYLLDSRRCIAYLTIELRGTIPEPLREPMGRHVFGCDICQDVCPWNRRAPITLAKEFQPRIFSDTAATNTKCSLSTAVHEARESEESLFLPRLEWLASRTEEQFRALFRGSPIKRAKWRGLIRNACIALGNAAPARDSVECQSIHKLLTKLSSSSEPLISESAQWALSRIQ
ncbi:MAG TPA: tRNA epoxyqueuosine(34) reductase QueG [Candidatus Methylomirabilis sp.]|nr:tRNA epoxyqueuosine(34) reductase QueG [Candidatus Methylomirabilis sp.]